jgi:hypothetical protein
MHLSLYEISYSMVFPRIFRLLETLFNHTNKFIHCKWAVVRFQNPNLVQLQSVGKDEIQSKMWGVVMPITMRLRSQRHIP